MPDRKRGKDNSILTWSGTEKDCIGFFKAGDPVLYVIGTKKPKDPKGEIDKPMLFVTSEAGGVGYLDILNKIDLIPDTVLVGECVADPNGYGFITYDDWDRLNGGTPPDPETYFNIAKENGVVVVLKSTQ